MVIEESLKGAKLSEPRNFNNMKSRIDADRIFIMLKCENNNACRRSNWQV